MVGVGVARQVDRGGAGGVATSALDELEEIVDELAALVKAESPVVAIPFAQMAQRVFEAIELAKIAEHKRSGASDRDMRRRAAAGGTRSKKAASRATKRADAVDANPALADDVEKGELGEEQLDAIAVASGKSSGDAAVDVKLIDEVKRSPADDAGKITSRWLERRDDENSAQSDTSGSANVAPFGSGTTRGRRANRSRPRATVSRSKNSERPFELVQRSCIGPMAGETCRSANIPAHMRIACSMRYINF